MNYYIIINIYFYDAHWQLKTCKLLREHLSLMFKFWANLHLWGLFYLLIFQKIHISAHIAANWAENAKVNISFQQNHDVTLISTFWPLVVNKSQSYFSNCSDHYIVNERHCSFVKFQKPLELKDKTTDKILLQEVVRMLEWYKKLWQLCSGMDKKSHCQL